MNDAANVGLALRTEHQGPEAPPSPSAAPTAGPSGTEPLQIRTRAFSSASPLSSSATPRQPAINIEGHTSPSADELQYAAISGRRGSAGGFFSRHSSPGRSAADEPPMPLNLEMEDVRTFDMGPRMSSNYHSVGMSLGGSLNGLGVPLGGTITFESSGGHGALLISRDPVERRLLRHEGVLKAYLRAHRKSIFEMFGEAEDVKLDDLMLVYGQDCTTDWAVAVTLEAKKGSRVEFEVFAAAKAGVWGGWRTSCSASQRGPHRETQPSDKSKGTEEDNEMQPMDVETMLPSNDAGEQQSGSEGQMQMDMNATIGVGDATFTINNGASNGKSDSSYGAWEDAAMPTARMPKWRWSKRADGTAIDQTIVLRRITAKSRFAFPTVIQASAGPSRDGWGGRRDGKAREETSGPSIGGSTWDPLDVVHGYILRNTDSSVQCSIASDQDAHMLLQQVLLELQERGCERSRWNVELLEAGMNAVAQKMFRISVDGTGTATIERARANVPLYKQSWSPLQTCRPKQNKACVHNAAISQSLATLTA